MREKVSEESRFGRLPAWARSAVLDLERTLADRDRTIRRMSEGRETSIYYHPSYSEWERKVFLPSDSTIYFGNDQSGLRVRILRENERGLTASITGMRQLSFRPAAGNALVLKDGDWSDEPC